MELKFNTYYIVTKGNDLAKEGDTLLLRYSKNKDQYSTLGEYTIFLPPNENQKSFFGMKPMNNVTYYSTKEELFKALEGVEVKYNLELVKSFIKDKQEEINKLAIAHEIIF